MRFGLLEANVSFPEVWPPDLMFFDQRGKVRGAKSLGAEKPRPEKRARVYQY